MSTQWETARIADLIREYIATSAWSVPFTVPQRSYAPYADVEDLTALKVTVVPETAVEQERIARKAIREEHTLSVGFQVQVEPESTTATTTIDKYTGLMQEVVDHFREVKSIPNYGNSSALTGTAISTEPDALRTSGVFVGWIELRYMVTR